eukprot:gene234-1096_t
MLGQKYMARSKTFYASNSVASNEKAPSPPPSLPSNVVPTTTLIATSMLNKMKSTSLVTGKTRKFNSGFVGWMGAAMVGGALLVGLPAVAGYFYLGGSAATVAGSLSAVPAASSTCVAMPLLPSLGALSTILMNSVDDKNKLSVAGAQGGNINSSGSSSAPDVRRAGGKNSGVLGGGVFSFANFMLSRGRRRS